MGRALRWLLALLLLLALLVGGRLVWRAWQLEPPEPNGAAPSASINLDGEAALQRLAEAIRLPTVSASQPFDAKPFVAFIEQLRLQFPLMHSVLQREIVNDYSLVYRWKGLASDAASPNLLLAHYDVVPTSAQGWEAAPFSGERKDGKLYGRGAVDDKGALMAICEAIEALLAEGYDPQRDLYFAFGHDEEVGGNDGAVAIAASFRQRGLHFDLLLDEGSVVARGLMPGLEPDLALIGVAEKHYVSLELRLQVEKGGHSSMPPAQTAIGRLAAALTRLEEQPMPARLIPPVRRMLSIIAPHVSFAQRIGLANLDWLEPVVLQQLAGRQRPASLVRDTTAITMIEAGIKDNVLPRSARAVVNFRLLPGTSREQLITAVQARLDDPAISILPFGGFAGPAPAYSRHDGPNWDKLTASIAKLFPQALIAPTVTSATTDTRHYQDLATDRYRFMPFTLEGEQIESIHSSNEHIPEAVYLRGIDFYHDLLQRLGAP